MQHIMVHIETSLGPIGAWSYPEDGHLIHFYPESLDVSIPGRARLLMAKRDDDVSVPEWMDFISDNFEDSLDEYQTFEVHDGISLNLVLAEFRRSWVASD